MIIKKEHYDYFYKFKKVDGKYDIDNVVEVIGEVGLENILDFEFVALVRMLEDHQLLLLLISIGSELEITPNPYKRIMAAYHVYLGICSVESGVKICESAGYKNREFYINLFNVAKDREKLLNFGNMQINTDDLEFSIGYLIDIHQPHQVPNILKKWMRVNPEMAWLKTCRLIAIRESLIIKKSVAKGLAILLELCIELSPKKQNDVVKILYSRLASFWLKAGKGGLAMLPIKKYRETNDDILGRKLELRALLLKKELAEAISISEDIIIYTSNIKSEFLDFEDKNLRDFDPQAAERTLKLVNSALRDRGLKPFLMSGTLLGYLRNGNILPHDKDVDIGIIGWENQFEVAQVLADLGHFYIDYERLKGDKVFLLNPKDMKNDMAIDVFLFHDKGDHFLHGIDFALGYTQNYKFTKFDLKEVVFLGEKFYIPDQPELNMCENYGDWRTSIPGYVVSVESPAIAYKGSLEHKVSAHLEIIASMHKGFSIDKIQRIVNYSNNHEKLLSDKTLNACMRWIDRVNSFSMDKLQSSN
jgi:hypothetical protein